jgi:hypothetical protein
MTLLIVERRAALDERACLLALGCVYLPAVT